MSAPCPYCSSTTFEEEDGLLVCSNCGRRVEGAQQLTMAEEEFGSLGKITRLARDRESRPKPTKTVRGAKAYRLYVLAWQHILYRQAHALHHLGAPTELWTIARNLYALMLARIVDRFDPNDMSSHTKTTGSIPSTSFDSADTEAFTTTDSEGSKTKVSLEPKLHDTLSLLYLAALVVRYPLPLSQLFTYTITEQIPFIRAVRHIPSLASRLPSEYQEALDTTSLPTCTDVQRHTYAFLSHFTTVHGLTLPAQNFRPVLWSFISQLDLPLETYASTLTLIDLLGYTFTFNFSKRRSSISIPELALVSVLVVSAKFVVPFHGSGDGFSLDWDAWVDRQRPERQSISTKAIDVQKLEPEEMDAYMDWYQGMFVSKKETTELERKIFELFPLGEVGDREQSARENRSLVVPGGERNGYLVVNDVEALMGMDERVVLFHERAAELACASLKQLLRAVRHTERKIEGIKRERESSA